MMLMWVLALTTLLASDVAETTNYLGQEETQHHLEKRELFKGPCAEDWFYFPSLKSCHRFFAVKKTWSDAEMMCNAQTHYANLATVNSPEQDEFIAKVINTVSKSSTRAWIGLNDLCKEGTFKWIDGTRLGYQHWSDTQPDNRYGHEDCVILNYFKEGSWNDVECGSGYGFVCYYHLP
ncbi:alpha-N-acetylgalactosamine-specific lectin-like [Leucoraja erinacea]|uniref:alpha-N-acetylgalactosamine-specific lectin-like n=1 Tax=Leucoraja erinaceus TaxID=7782 RepID=UPI0024538C3B|nr:alpha-N-acetylgalactosamine-specific lectin-like [Leucoraja erinacea]